MKFTDYNSPEKAIINDTFKIIPYMDMWISSIVEGYIYEKVDKVDDKGNREEYTERYGKKEGEYKVWYENGQLWAQEYYKEGKMEGEFKVWWCNGQLWAQEYYKEGKLEGEHKRWGMNGELYIKSYYKEGEEVHEYNCCVIS